MDLPRNSFKHAIAAGQLQIGLWSSLCSNIGVEIVADSGFDWILLDTEHSPNEIPGDDALAAPGDGRGTATPIIRPAWNDVVLVKRVLDIGTQSVLVPYVQNPEEARRAVAAVRYPPAGIRGVAAASRAGRYGRITDYLKKANDEICLLVQVETRAALEELEAVAKVEGVDGVFIGPSDLSASFGHIGNPQHPEVQKAIEEAARTIRSAGKAAGILTANEDEARRYIGWGYTFVAVGSDTVPPRPQRGRAGEEVQELRRGDCSPHHASREPSMPAERFDFPNAQGERLAALLDAAGGAARLCAVRALLHLRQGRAGGDAHRRRR